jgi:hypothetical protein
MKKILLLCVLTIATVNSIQAQYIRIVQDTTAFPTTNLWDGKFIRISGAFYEYKNGGWYKGNVYNMISTDSLPAAKKLITPRTINGVPFDGTQNITVSGGSSGSLFEIDGNGYLRPIAGTSSDDFWEIDINGFIRPKL